MLVRRRGGILNVPILAIVGTVGLGVIQLPFVGLIHRSSWPLWFVGVLVFGGAWITITTLRVFRRDDMVIVTSLVSRSLVPMEGARIVLRFSGTGGTGGGYYDVRITDGRREVKVARGIAIPQIAVARARVLSSALDLPFDQSSNPLRQ